MCILYIDLISYVDKSGKGKEIVSGLVFFLKCIFSDMTLYEVTTSVSCLYTCKHL